MSKIRVLVVDDAILVRRMVTQILGEDPEIEVVGAAQNGKIALQKLPELKPDLVILDIEMPEMNGLDCLRELRKGYPRLPVIMFSTLTERGASATLEALHRGASDYVTKPSSTKSTAEAIQRVRDALVPRIKALCPRARTAESPTKDRPGGAARAAARPAVPTPVPARPRAAGAGNQRVDILAVGCSTGGPMALERVMKDLPKDLPVPVVVVQHMPPLFTGFLAKRLAAECPLAFEEAKGGARLEPGRAFIAPGDFHMTVISGAVPHVELNQESPENSCRPAVDPLFRSVAQAYKGNVLAVVLTGMGQDGMKGCESVRAAGGQVVVQDEATSVVWGMPGAVARAGLADAVLPIEKIATEILTRVARYRRVQPAAARP